MNPRCIYTDKHAASFLEAMQVSSISSGVSPRASVIPAYRCQERCSSQSVSQDTWWQLPLSGLDDVPRDERVRELERSQRKRRERWFQTEMELLCEFSVVYLLKKLWRRNSVVYHEAVSHTRDPSTNKCRANGALFLSFLETTLVFLFGWAVRKLVRYWTFQHIINLTSLAGL